MTNKNYQIEFSEWLLNIMPYSYFSWINENNINSKLEEIKNLFKESFYVDNIFDIDIDDITNYSEQLGKFCSNKKETLFGIYSEKASNGVPNAIINTHYRCYINALNKKVYFKSASELIEKINKELGKKWCDNFQEKRKSLLNLGRSATKGQLFKTSNRDNWFINEGGETEVQYHCAFYPDEECIVYGLGFNTQYVPNSTDTMSHIIPYMNAFLNKKDECLKSMYNCKYLRGSEEQLINPQKDQYILFGKQIYVNKNNEVDEDLSYSIEKVDFEMLIYNLKEWLKPYETIIEERNKLIKTANINSEMSNTTQQVLKSKKQIILQGAPGTGKTYTAKEVAEQLIFGNISESKKDQSARLENSNQYKLIQFHPSYSYEDFVRGIITETESGSVNYKTVDRVLSEFAKKAIRNWEDSNKPVEQLSKEQGYENALSEYRNYINEKLANGEDFKIPNTTAFIIQIDEDSFRYSFKNRPSIIYNLLFQDLIKIGLNKDLITKSTDVENCGLKMKGKHPYYYHLFNAFQSYIQEQGLQIEQNSHEVEELNFVLIIDEINRANLPAVLGELVYALEYRGESVESMYTVDGDNKLMLPPNLYIIGTMNTADRSVGQIDYAIRRRFAFVDMLPQILDSIDGFDSELFKKISELFIDNYDSYINNPNTVLSRSEYLSEDFRPEDVWLGHSYFIMKNDGNNCREMRLTYEIKPILKEYIKDGILKPSAEQIINQII